MKQTLQKAKTIAKIAIAAKNIKSAKDEHNKQIAQNAIINLLSESRGIPMKIGQFLATTTDKDYLTTLTKSIQPIPLQNIKPHIQDQLPTTIQETFASLDEANAAASLGQVHKATLASDNTTVAVKIQYPDIQKSIKSELQLIGLIPNLGPQRKWGFDIKQYKQTLQQNMHEELDYTHELEIQNKFHKNLNIDSLITPKPYPKLSNSKMLIQEWCSGQSLEQAASFPTDDRITIARTLMITLFKSIFELGHVHADPHQGNYFFNNATNNAPANVVLLDYGSTIQISYQTRMALLKLLIGAKQQNQTDPLTCFAAMGFDPEKLKDISAQLPAMCQILFEPFLQNQAFNHKQWDIGKQYDALLGELKWWFRAAAPANLLLLMRAFSGLLKQLTTLKINLPWWELLEIALSPQTIGQAIAYPLDKIDHETKTFSSLAKLLKVQVFENGQQTVALSMPANQILKLQEIMPEDTLQNLKDAKIDLNKHIQSAIDNGLAPQLIFQNTTNNKTYKVWLE